MRTEKQILIMLKSVHKKMDELCKKLDIEVNRIEYNRLLLQSITLNWVLNK